jgi:transcriptional regulator with XRE-family HTH domain
MIDSRKTGAYISRLRREKDWTQLELAERLHVTPQAVSRWETGESFPDISLLAQISLIFRVSVDDLLQGEPSPQLQGRQKATTGDIISELAQGRPESVARMVLEDKADLNSLLDAGPLTRPSTMDKVIKNMSGFKFSFEQIVWLAPFVGEDILSSLVDEIVDAKMDHNLLGNLAPFLSKETLDRLVERVIDGEIDAKFLTDIAPFLKRETLDRLADQIKDGTLEKSYLVGLAPFLSSAALNKLVFETKNEELDMALIESIAPFLSKETLDRLVDRVANGRMEPHSLVSLAPFLSRETLKRSSNMLRLAP